MHGERDISRDQPRSAEISSSLPSYRCAYFELISAAVLEQLFDLIHLVTHGLELGIHGLKIGTHLGIHGLELGTHGINLGIDSGQLGLLHPSRGIDCLAKRDYSPMPRRIVCGDLYGLHAVEP